MTHHASLSLVFFLVAISALRGAFTLFLDRAHADIFGNMGNFVLVAVNAVGVISLLAPQLFALTVLRSFGVALFPRVAFGAERHFLHLTRIEALQRHPLVRMMAVDAS